MFHFFHNSCKKEANFNSQCVEAYNLINLQFFVLNQHITINSFCVQIILFILKSSSNLPIEGKVGKPGKLVVRVKCFLLISFLKMSIKQHLFLSIKYIKLKMLLQTFMNIIYLLKKIEKMCNQGFPVIIFFRLNFEKYRLIINGFR